MNAWSEEAEAFFWEHSGLSRERVAAEAESAARRNAELIAADMRELAKHPLDLEGVPHAAEVQAVLGDDLHPLTEHSFWTRVREYLRIEDEPVSVREWLVRGGDLQTAIWCAEAESILG